MAAALWSWREAGKFCSNARDLAGVLGDMRAYLRLCRPHQWTKNLFVAAALCFTPAAMSWANAGRVALGFLLFCAVASAVYILNDAIDRAADRQHPVKRDRPLAAGRARLGPALALAALLGLGGLAGGYLLQLAFGHWLAVYLALNLGYCLGLKHVSILDVMLIAVGFVLRLEAGAALIATPPSVWIVLCTFLLALFLAIAKRRDDLVGELDRAHRRSLEGYNKVFLDAAMTVVLGALMVFYALYTTDEAVMARRGPDQLHLSGPLGAAGCPRPLQIALVEQRSGAPTEIVLRARFLILAILGWALLMGLLIHG